MGQAQTLHCGTGALFAHWLPHLAQYASWIASSPAAVTLSTVVAVWLIDFSLDALQSPVRLYMMDVTPVEQQDRANALFGVFAGLGGCIGYLCGFVDWLALPAAAASAPAAPGLDALVTQLRIVCWLVCLIVSVLMLVTLTSVPESCQTPPKPRTGLGATGVDAVSTTNPEEDVATEDDEAFPCSSSPPSPSSSSSTSAGVNGSNVPSTGNYLLPLCAVQFAGMLCYTSFLLYYTEFTATVLYSGSPTGEHCVSERE